MVQYVTLVSRGLTSFEEKDNLTNEIVKTWVFKIIGPDAKAAFESEVSKAVAEKIEPTEITVVLES